MLFKSFLLQRGIASPTRYICIQWNLSKADTYGAEVFVCFIEVSALERFELKSSQI